VKFTAVEGENVTISYTTVLEEGETYTTTGVFINALVFDQPNPKTTALNPYPANNDIHVDGDDGTIDLTWVMATSAVKNHIYMGTSLDGMSEVAVNAEGKYTLSDVYSMNTYYWRVDEEDADGTIYRGETWMFRPRHLAFPGAEGYGRFATGGRGGSVYHVTSLADDATNPQPGTLRYGLTKVSNAKAYLYFLPLALLVSVNLWNGIHINHTGSEILFHILTMFNIGFLEELIFRGFLFKMMAKDNVRLAIVVSAITFGIGHIVNLFNGADLIPTLLQICYAISIGYLFVIVFYKSGSIIPCIIAHALINACSIFNIETAVSLYIAPVVLVIVPIVYAVYIDKTVIKQ
jgi:membrane protease YdiL (CAAX protease family)